MNMAVRFIVQARSHPQALARIINHVAQLGITPKRVCADENNGIMTIFMEQDGICDRQARIIAEKMYTSVLVQKVKLIRGESQLASLNRQAQ